MNLEFDHRERAPKEAKKVIPNTRGREVKGYRGTGQKNGEILNSAREGYFL